VFLTGKSHPDVKALHQTEVSSLVREMVKFSSELAILETQQHLVKTGGRRVKHARYYWLLSAESHLTRRLFGSMVRRTAALPLPTG